MHWLKIFREALLRMYILRTDLKKFTLRGRNGQVD